MSDEMQNDAIKLAKEAFQIEYKDNISKVDFSKIHIAKGHLGVPTYVVMCPKSKISYC